MPSKINQTTLSLTKDEFLQLPPSKLAEIVQEMGDQEILQHWQLSKGEHKALQNRIGRIKSKPLLGLQLASQKSVSRKNSSKDGEKGEEDKPAKRTGKRIARRASFAGSPAIPSP